ncbi:MAG: hypothetical protein ACYDEP_02450 [Acidimicrobiales bacterium]
MIVTVEVDAENGEIDIPKHPDGGEYTYAICTAHGEAVFTDSLVEALAQQIPGYADFVSRASGTDSALDELLGLRYDDLRLYADALQRWMIDDAIENGKIDVTSIGDQKLSALMNERLIPFEGIEEDDGTADFTWECKVPLILFVTDYEPYTNRPQPDGQIMWLDPSTELTYMQSLDTLGVVDFLVLDQPLRPKGRSL